MNRVAITERPPSGASRQYPPGVHLRGDTESRQVIGADDFRLSLWRHSLDSGAIVVDRPGEDHTFYVLQGDVSVGGTPAGAGGVISVGRHGTATIEGRGEVLHYVGHAESRPDKPGGCVHILPQGWEERTPVSSHALFLDSSCPCCSVWLHRTGSAAGRAVAPHHHTEDEIICVVEGAMDLGVRHLETGGAVGVAKDTVYSFTAGPAGLTFVNFRQSDPYFVPKVKPAKTPESERLLMRALLERLASERLGSQPAHPA